ncbi:MAG TPA: C13 family peptidase [Stellaceae bacterium]|nr:C13 family peptidase [Stellaceae bacterium]
MTNPRNHWRRLVQAAALCLSLAACAGAQNASTQNAAADDPAPQPSGWKAVLIAGDLQERAFDDAVNAMADKLASYGVPRANMTVLKASAIGPDAASRANVRTALTHLDPGRGEGCFVYVTSHGAKGRGLVIVSALMFLSPADLDQMLVEGCGNHPTVVVASGCYSGIFAEAPLTAPNRVILTAARPDRPSFGCNAQQEYTVFDRCVLQDVEAGLSWKAAMDRTRACVSKNEAELDVDAPSEPQLSIGADERGLRVFARRAP